MDSKQQFNFNEFIGTDVRKTFKLNDKEIYVYNFTKKDRADIIKLQEDYKNETNNMEFDDRTVLTVIIPMFTNLPFDKIEDELLIQKMIERPHPVLELIMIEIKTMINEINAIETKEILNSLHSAKNFMTNIDIIQQIPDDMMVRIQHANNNKKIKQKIDTLYDSAMENLVKTEEQDQLTKEEMEVIERAKKLGVVKK